MIIFIAHHFAFFVYSSLSLQKDMSIPAPTIARTPRRRTILMKYLMIVARRLWKLHNPGSIVHSYNLFSTDAHADSWKVHPALIDQHLQLPPGIRSDVYIFIGHLFDGGVVLSIKLQFRFCDHAVSFHVHHHFSSHMTSLPLERFL